jgi:hypothetical protein
MTWRIIHRELLRNVSTGRDILTIKEAERQKQRPIRDDVEEEEYRRSVQSGSWFHCPIRRLSPTVPSEWTAIEFGAQILELHFWCEFNPGQKDM